MPTLEPPGDVAVSAEHAARANDSATRDGRLMGLPVPGAAHGSPQKFYVEPHVDRAFYRSGLRGAPSRTHLASSIRPRSIVPFVCARPTDARRPPREARERSSLGR